MKYWILVLAVALCLFLLDLPLLNRTRHKRDWLVYGVILAAGVISTSLAAPQRRTPSLLNFLLWLYGPVNSWLGSWFQ
ncbi:hypothetical protein ACE3NQ_12485 [Paenibacillus terreus]|uniref:Uncharacterized protein n=1 Tax=Paenibacillus terreus TaxID=1387834 RepID=A0ABV5B7R6_9BACL